ncbi:MAG: amidohydrolase [Anaerolineae bacterium]|nr:amidohydrolase [Anaerolineae bacterium]
MPNLILYHGKLHTQDADYPDATAIALRDGRILAVGRDSEIRALAKTDTEEIDLEGRRVLPGLTDSHIHFYDWSLFLERIQLDDVASLAEVQELVYKTAKMTGPGEWVIGQGWNEESWDPPKMPTRSDLDAVAPDHPVIIWRKDLHLASVNSLALKLANISGATPDPDMGVIERDEFGNPNGILKELAINLVRDIMPQPSEMLIDNAMKNAMMKIHQLGITGVHDMRIMGGEDGPPALHTWQRLRDTDEVRLRALVMLPGELLDQAVSLGLQSGLGDEFLRIGGIKLFSDGATGARTSWMLEPFADGGSGMPLTPMQEIAEKIAKADQAGITATIHSIGDRANRELLDVFSEVLGKNENRTSLHGRHRIEHVQHSHPDDLGRLGPLDLVASVQPLHLVEDISMVDKAIGDRGQWTYAFRDLLDAETILAFGSDCPVSSPNPFLGIQAAVTRQRADGTPEGGWYPSQRLTVEEAVYGYTMGAAIAAGVENDQGSLTPGKLADLIVLDQDIFSIPPLEIAKTQVDKTVFNGDVVFDRLS